MRRTHRPPREPSPNRNCPTQLRYPCGMPLLCTLCLASLLTPTAMLTAAAQTRKPAPTPPPVAGRAPVRTTSNPERPVPPALRPYLGCKLPNGPELVGQTLLPQAPMARTAQTFSGPKKINLLDGVMAAFAFSGEPTFANVKVELLPAATYATEKNDLISEFDKINATGNDTQRNYVMKPTLNGFGIQGFDRTALDGKVLGIYLLFDNAHHVATTAYFLNAPPGQRKFNSLNEYNAVREDFLNTYTACVRKALGGAAATPVKAPKLPAAKPVVTHRAR